MKPKHIKPSFYAFIYEQIKDIAEDCGYNLVLHGSMNRDLDLIAIPWIDNPKPELELVHRIDCIINEIPRNAEHNYQFSVLPGGRNSYVINICRGGEWNKYQDAKLRKIVTNIEENELSADYNPNDAFATGGIVTKLKAADFLLKHGKKMFLSSGFDLHAAKMFLMDGEQSEGTLFDGVKS